MALSFHKNAILQGYVDHYCLVCESHLKSEDDIHIHIAKPIHRKNLDAAAYVDKFPDDCVRKVKKGYYCEFCNILLSTAAKVNLHVAEPKHFSNKGLNLLRRSGSSVIAFKDVLINEKAWNGLIEETCATCNTEFDDEHIHKTESSHILSLIQRNVEFGVGKAVYRKVDDSSFQCLTCNRVLAMSALETHFDLSEHKDLVLYHKDEVKKEDGGAKKAEKDAAKDNKAVTKVDIKKPEVKPVPKTKSAPFELKFHFGDPPKKKDAKVDAKKETAPAKKIEPKKEAPIEPKKPDAETKKPENVTLSKKPIRPIKLEPCTTDLDEEMCKTLGAKEYVADDLKGKKWCLLCDWTMEVTAIGSHIKGRHHQTMLKMHKERIAKKMKTISGETAVKNEPKETGVSAKPVPDVESVANILENVTRFANNEINVNFESKTVVCKKCKKDIDFNYNTIENHIEEHKREHRIAKKEAAVAKQETNDQVKNDTASKPKTLIKANESAAAKPKTNETEAKKAQTAKNTDHNDNRSERSSSVASRDADDDAENYAEEMAKANNLIHRGGAQVYCKVCDTRIPFTIKKMREHINGFSHKKKIAVILANNNTKTVKIATGDFIKTLVTVENGLNRDVIINDKFCLNISSFLMITRYNGGLKCFACDVDLTFAEADAHKTLPLHVRAMCETLVLSLDSEFIREIQPELLHCGYCNTLTEPEDLEDHIGTTCHRESRAVSRWRLQQYTGEIVLQRPWHDLDILTLIRMLIVN